MYILKNAWISITRNKSRNILIGIIIMIIACASTITLAIKNTASDLIGSYKSSYDKEVTISFDRKSMMKNFDMSSEGSRDEAKKSFNEISSLSLDDVKKYGEAEHIVNYNYTYDIGLNGNNIEKTSSENKGDVRGGKGGPMGMQSSHDFSLVGYDSIDSLTKYINDNYTIEEFNEDIWDSVISGKNVLINYELAIYNNIKLNDVIKLEDDNNNVYEFTVVGIYKEKESSDDNVGNMSMFSNSSNIILTNSDCLVDIVNSNSSITNKVNPTFIIDDYSNVETVQKEFYDFGLSDKYVLSSNEELANSSLSGVSNVDGFATTFLIITLIIGGVVLLIINLINIRERKYEIGVFRTIGFSKTKLTIQFLAELLIVAMLSLSLGAGLGASMSKSVSNSLLSSEIESGSKKTEEMKNNFGGRMPGNMPGKSGGFGGVHVVQAYSSIDAVVNVSVIGELMFIGVSLVLVSSLSAMIGIQRFSPLTILKERS